LADSDQAHRSLHHKAFLEPDAADVVLADDAKWLRERLKAAGVPGEAIARHLAVLGNKPAMEAALAWYRARGAIRGPLGPIRVPTLYISGAMPTTPSAGPPPKARRISSPRRIPSRCSRASAISRPTRRRIASANSCYGTSHAIRREPLTPPSPSRRRAPRWSPSGSAAPPSAKATQRDWRAARRVRSIPASA